MNQLSVLKPNCKGFSVYTTKAVATWYYQAIPILKCIQLGFSVFRIFHQSCCKYSQLSTLNTYFRGKYQWICEKIATLLHIFWKKMWQNWPDFKNQASPRAGLFLRPCWTDSLLWQEKVEFQNQGAETYSISQGRCNEFQSKGAALSNSGIAKYLYVY